MWWNLRLVAVGVVVIATFVWAAIDMWHAQWWQAVGTLATGIVVALVLLGAREDDAAWIVGCATLAVGLGGIGHLLFESPLTNGPRQQGLSSLTYAFVRMSATTGLTQGEQNATMVGLTACAAQPNFDAFVTVGDAIKVIHETPAMSMLDRASGMGNPPPSPEECINTYRQVRPLMPWAFREAEAESPWLLTQLNTY